MAKQLNVNLSFTADTSQAAAQVRSLQQSLTQLINQPVGIGERLSADMLKATQAAAELKMHLQSATNVDTGTLDFGKLNQSLKASGVSLQQYATQLQSLGPRGQQAFMQLARSVANAEVPLRRSNALLSQFSTTLANTARWQLSSTMLHGFISAVSTAWNYSQDLNESLNNIRIVTGKNIDEMSRFADQANRAAKALSTTTTEYTNASLIYYQQGLSDAEVLGRTETTIKMANASRQSAEIVSDQMTAIWNNFYDGSKSLDYYADVVTALGAATASSSEEIAQGLEKFAAVADTVGLSYEYATAALATVTATTRQSADVVGTAFKTLFARLSDLKLGETLDDGTTLGSYSDNLAKIGVNIKDASGQLKDMDTILNETAAKWENLDKAQQVALAKGVAGIRQYTQFIALMDNWDFMEKNLNTAKESGGTLAKQAKTYEESWEAASKRVKASLETIYAAIMDDEFFIDLTNGFAVLIDKVGGFVKSIGGLQGVLSGLGWILTKVFAEQMAQGFQNLYYNIQMSSEAGRKAIQDMKIGQMQSFADSMLNYETSTVTGKTAKQVYSEELVMQQQLAEKADQMTAAEQQKCKFLIEQHRIMGEQSMEIAKQLEMTKERVATDRIDLMGTGLNNGQHMDSVVKALDRAKGRANAMVEVRDILKSIGTTAEISKDQIDNLSKKLGEAGVRKGDIVQLSNALQSASGDSAAMGVAIERVNGYLSEATLRTSQVIARILGIRQGTPEFEQLASRVAQYMNNTQQATMQQNQLNNTLDNGTDMAHQFGDALNKMGQKAQTASQLLSTAVSGLMSLGMLISSVSGLIDTIQDPDASGWEKFGRILTSVSMIAMSVMGTFTGLKAAYDLLSSGIIKNTLITTANSLAQHLNEKAQKKKSMATTISNIIARISNKTTRQSSIENTKEAAANEVGARALRKENAEKMKSIALDKIRGRTVTGPITGQKGQKFSLKGIGGGKTTPKLNAGTLKTLFSALGKFAAAAAAVAIVAGTVALAVETYNKHNKAAKEAAAQAQEAATAFNKVQESYNTFTENIQTYKDAKEGMASLTRGTVEYQQAIIKANDAAMQLLNTYKDLQYTINSEGLIEIDANSLLQAQKAELERLQSAQQAQMLAQANATKAQADANAINFQRDKLKSINGSDNAETAGNAAIAGGAGAAAGALGAVALGAASGPVGWAALIVGALAAAVGGIVTAVAGRANDEEETALNKLATIYAEEGSARFSEAKAFENLLEEQGITDPKLVSSLTANREATLQLVSEMAVANAQMKNANTSVIKDEYNDVLTNKYGLSEAESLQVSSIMSAKLENLTEQLYDETYEDQLFGMTDADIQKQYAAAMGWATDTIDNQNGNKAKYYDKAGNEIGVISDEVARKYLAQQAALKKLQPMLESTAVKFRELSTSANAADNGLANFLKTQDFYGISQQQYIEMQKEIAGDNGVVDSGEIEQYLINKFASNGQYLTEEDALAAGYNSVDEFIADFTNNFSKYGKQRNEAFEEFAPEVQSAMSQLDLDKFSITAVDMLGDSLTSALTSLKSEKAVEELMNIYKKAGDEAGVMVEALSGIDWSSATPETLISKFDELGVTTQFTEQELDLLIATMSAGLVDVASKVKLLDEVAKLESGNTISIEQYNKLSASAQSYFQLMADGTMKLVGDAAEFYDLVMAEKRDIISREQQFNISDLDKNITYWKGQISPAERANQIKPWSIQEQDLFNQYLESKFGAGTYEIDDYTDYSGNFGIEHNMVMGGNRELTFLYSANGDWRGNTDTDSWNQTTGEYGWYDGTTGATTQAFMTEEEFFNYFIGGDVENQWKTKYRSFTNHINDMLDILGDSDYWMSSGDNSDLLASWKKTLSEGSYAQVYEMYDEIINAVQVQLPAAQKELNGKIDELTKEVTANTFQVLSTYDTAMEREKVFLQQMANTSIDNQETRDAILEGYMQAQGAAIEEEAMRGLDIEEVKAYGDYLEQLFDFEDETNDSDDLAQVILKLNRGLESLSSNFNNWGVILNQISNGNKTAIRATEEYREAFLGARDAIADILDVSADFINMDFVESNLGIIEKIAEGDKEAIRDLGFEFARMMAKSQGSQLTIDQLKNLGMSAEEAIQHIESLQNKVEELAGIEMPILEIGSPVSDEFFAAMQAVVDAAAMTAEEANSYYRSMGFTPVYEETDVPASQGSVTVKTIQGRRVEGDNGSYTIYETVSEEEVPIGDATTSLPELKVQTSDGQMTKATDATSGNKTVKSKGAKPSRLIYTGGGALGNTVTGAGKGGSKSSKITKKDEVIERYKEITDKINDQKKLMDDASKAADRLWGPSRIEAMRKVNQVLEKNINLLKDKRAEAKYNLEEDKKALKNTIKTNAGVPITDAMFDEKGNFTAYDEVLGGLYNELHAAEKSAGKTVDDHEQERINAIQERIDAVKDAIANYDETNQLIKELDTEIQDAIYEWQDNNYEVLKVKLEYEIAINESELELIDYYLGKAQGNIYSFVEAMGQYEAQNNLYTDSLQAQEDHYYRLEDAYNAGEISLQAYKEGLQSSQSAIISNLQSLEESKQAMQDYYGNVMSMAIEEIGLYTTEMEQLNSVLDHYSNIIEIIGKQDDTITKGKILASKANNLKNELAIQSKLYKETSADAEYWAQKMAESIEGSNEYETFKKNWQAAQQAANEAQDAMLSKTQEWAEAMKAIVENELAGLTTSMEESLTGGLSFDELMTSMERRSSLQEEYLTTTNKIYETNKLMQTAQQEIDKTTNTVAKKRLQNFIRETNELQGQTKLSQYELEIQQAKYDLLLAEIALEEAQQAKSTVRLTRDSEGNFGYVYTADANAVADAEQQLADAQNNLYNIGLEGANDYQQKYAETLQESQDAITELTTMWMSGEIASEEEFNRRKQEIVEYYGEKLKQYSYLHSVALSTDSRVVADAWSSDFTDMMVTTEQWKDQVNSYFKSAADSMETWAEVCATTVKESGLDDIEKSLESVSEKSKQWITTLIGEDGKSGIIGALMAQVDVASEVSKSSITIQDAISKTTAEYEALLTAINNAYTAMATPVIPPRISLSGGEYLSVDSWKTNGGNDDGTQIGGNPMRYSDYAIKQAQAYIGVEQDGSWGKKSKAKAMEMIGSSNIGDVLKAMDSKVSITLYASPGGGSMGKYTFSKGKFIITDMGYDDRYYTYKVTNIDTGFSGYVTNMDKDKLVSLDTGGYTGEWGAEGKMAMLHEKELILNADDTTNFLASLEVLREIVNTINLHSMNAQLGGLLNSPNHINSNNTRTLEQQVTIEAHFPNASDRNEIEEAFGNLINLASQYANRK